MKIPVELYGTWNFVLCSAENGVWSLPTCLGCHWSLGISLEPFWRLYSVGAERSFRARFVEILDDTSQVEWLEDGGRAEGLLLDVLSACMEGIWYSAYPLPCQASTSLFCHGGLSACSRAPGSFLGPILL